MCYLYVSELFYEVFRFALLITIFYCAGMKILHQICVDIFGAFSTTQRFGTRKEVIRWIKEVRIHN